MSERVAVVDVGSNSVRLLVSDVIDDHPTFVHTDKVMARIGQSLGHEGRIDDRKIGEVAGIVSRFVEDARRFGAREIRAIATSATREAANGDELAEHVLAASGVPLEVIDGDEEARLAFVGTLASLDEPQAGDIGVVDVGGGSTEIVVGSAADGVAWSRSFRLGSGRLSDRFIEHDPPLASEIEQIRAAIDADAARRGRGADARARHRRRGLGDEPAPHGRPAARRRVARTRAAAADREPVAADRAAVPARADARPAAARRRADHPRRRCSGSARRSGSGAAASGRVSCSTWSRRTASHGEGAPSPRRPRRALRGGRPASPARARERVRRAGAGRQARGRHRAPARPAGLRAPAARRARGLRGAFPKKRHRSVLDEIKHRTERMGDARDLDVQLEFLDGFLEAAAPGERPGVEWLVATLRAERATAYGRLAPDLDALEHGGFLGRVDDLAGS